MFMTKVCKKCGVWKPVTKEFFHVKKENKDGFRGECKECRLSVQKQYYEKNKTQIIKNNTEYRKKDWDLFVKRRRDYEQRNKEKLFAWRKEYQRKNKEKIAKAKKNYVERNKEKSAEKYLNWARSNPDKCKEKRHKREARLKILPHTLTVKQWQIILKYFDCKCAYCGVQSNIQQDHFIPLSKGGGYTRDNIVPACKSCNSSKQDSNFFEWYPKYKYYDKKRESFILEHLGLQ